MGRRGLRSGPSSGHQPGAAENAAGLGFKRGHGLSLAGRGVALSVGSACSAVSAPLERVSSGAAFGSGSGTSDAPEGEAAEAVAERVLGGPVAAPVVAAAVVEAAPPGGT